MPDREERHLLSEDLGSGEPNPGLRPKFERKPELIAHLRLFLTGMLNSGLVIQINHSSTMSCPLTIHVDVFLI